MSRDQLEREVRDARAMRARLVEVEKEFRFGVMSPYASVFTDCATEIRDALELYKPEGMEP